MSDERIDVKALVGELRRSSSYYSISTKQALLSAANALEALENEREKTLQRLVQAYRDHPLAVADLIDNYLDRSGALLGRIRLYAREELRAAIDAARGATP